MSRQKVLVTGGAGFIGGNFVQYMVNKYPEYEIVNLDWLTYAGDLTKHEMIKTQGNYRFVQANIADRTVINELFEREKFTFVVHFAAESHVDRSISDPEVFVRTNVLGTQVLLDAAKKIGIRKFVHVSTDEVYGELELASDAFFNEESPVQPNSPYSASKAASDLLVRSYHQTFGMPVNITRCSNNYGPYHFPEKLIPLTITKVLRNQLVPVYGDGRNIRDWLHVWDHCSAVDMVMHKGGEGEVYNIGGHNERTNIDVVQTIIRALNKSYDLIEYVADRPGHDKRYAIDPTKIQGLGWSPIYTFDTGIAHTIQWYIENSQWWERLVSRG